MGDLISIIVPCYNEEESLRLFHQAVRKTEKEMPDCRFEILLINDGSKDKTVEVMRELAKEDPDVSLSAEERSIGGLGIFMVKKTMDDMQYVYRDGQNILSISKTI